MDNFPDPRVMYQSFAMVGTSIWKFNDIQKQIFYTQDLSLKVAFQFSFFSHSSISRVHTSSLNMKLSFRCWTIPDATPLPFQCFMHTTSYTRTRPHQIPKYAFLAQSHWICQQHLTIICKTYIFKWCSWFLRCPHHIHCNSSDLVFISIDLLDLQLVVKFPTLIWWKIDNKEHASIIRGLNVAKKLWIMNWR